MKEFLIFFISLILTWYICQKIADFFIHIQYKKRLENFRNKKIRNLDLTFGELKRFTEIYIDIHNRILLYNNTELITEEDEKFLRILEEYSYYFEND